MDKDEILEVLERDFRKALTLTEKSVVRKYQFPEAKNVIKVAIGMRRAGKTYFLFQTIREFLASGQSLEQILYLNFEDERLLPLEGSGMGALVDQWYSRYPENHERCCYLFLDEVQNVTGWPLVLRRLQDTKNLQIYVTGSSAKLLAKEIASSLRGRSLSVEILPYSYSEYLEAHKLEPTSTDFHRKYLKEYFLKGGFPAVQQMSHKEHLETLQNYVETVVFRDIVERHKVTNVALLKYFIGFLLKSVGAVFSIHKFYNDVKSQGHKVSKDTLHAYLGYLEDAFLIFPVPLFTESLRHQQTSPKKIYAIDNGLIGANTFNLSPNFGKYFENLIYLDLRRQGKKIFYYKTGEGYEIDFITQDLEGRYEILQVVWETDEVKTKERVLRALESAQQELGFPVRLIDFRNYLTTVPARKR